MLHPKHDWLSAATIRQFPNVDCYRLYPPNTYLTHYLVHSTTYIHNVIHTPRFTSIQLGIRNTRLAHLYDFFLLERGKQKEEELMNSESCGDSIE